MTSSSSPAAVQSARVVLTTDRTEPFAGVDVASGGSATGLGGADFGRDGLDFGFCVVICGLFVGWNRREAVRRKEKPRHP